MFFIYRQENSERKIYLVNFPIIFEIAASILQKSTPKEIRGSFQIYFKHRAKKLLLDNEQ